MAVIFYLIGILGTVAAIALMLNSPVLVAGPTFGTIALYVLIIAAGCLLDALHRNGRHLRELSDHTKHLREREKEQAKKQAEVEQRLRAL